MGCALDGTSLILRAAAAAAASESAHRSRVLRGIILAFSNPDALLLKTAIVLPFCVVHPILQRNQSSGCKFRQNASSRPSLAPPPQ